MRENEFDRPFFIHLFTRRTDGREKEDFGEKRSFSREAEMSEIGEEWKIGEIYTACDPSV